MSKRGPRLAIIPAGAVTDRRLSQRALQVLCLLGRHTDDNGWCRIRQTRMAEEIGCARSTIQAALDLLYEAKWVERRLEGRPGASSPDPEKQPYASHAYRVILDTSDADGGEMTPATDVDRCPENRAPQVPDQSGTTGPENRAPGADVCIGTNERPLLNESERETRARDDKRSPVRRFLLKWPSAAVDDKAHITKAWDALPDDEIEPALAGIEPFVAELKKHGRKHTPAGWKYLEDRSWKLIEKPAAAMPERTTFDCWSKEWWAVLLTKIERRQPIRFMIHFATDAGKRQHVEKTVDMPSAERLAEFKGYPSDGPEMAVWRPWFERRGVKLPLWEKRIWIFLPSPAPAGATTSTAPSPSTITPDDEAFMNQKGLG